MTARILKAVSWGHRRATGPMAPLAARFKALRPEIEVEWTVRPLSDFEHEGLAGVARRFDLIIFDHPFCGDIAESSAFLPLEDQVEGLSPAHAGRYVAASLASYTYAGHVWGAPIDAAAQNAIYRADLMDGAALPGNWDDVLALGKSLRRRGLFLGLAGETPHAVLGMAALMANAGKAWSTDPALPFTVDPHALLEALDATQALLAYCPPKCVAWNSIDLHDAMLARDDIAYAPCVYGYATYGEDDGRGRLSFAPFPGAGAAGTAIGGTAMGVSHHCKHPADAFAFVNFLLGDEAQCEIIAANHGQPAVARAWDDSEIDRRFNGYYSATRTTIESAWIRPRLPGYPLFQREAGKIVRQVLENLITARQAVDRIIDLAGRVNVGR